MIDVAVAGASGLVGRRIAERLRGHPWFRLVAELGPAARGLAPLEAAGSARAVFSALPAAVAREWEPRWVAEGRTVFGFSGPHPLGEGAPVVPELNAAALPPAEHPAIVLAPNCTAQGLALALAPLVPLGLERVLVSSMQAVSGAGRRGVPALEGGDNLVPFIAGEEERVEAEVAALLGGGLRLSCQCNRVPVEDGHTLSVAVAFARPVAREALLAAWRGFPALDLPSAPDPVLVFREEEDRPQPRLDREAQGGMQVTLGRLRPCAVLEHRFVVLVHNLERGAAGAAVLNAEAVFAGA